jgi:hypothetical protein
MFNSVEIHSLKRPSLLEVQAGTDWEPTTDEHFLYSTLGLVIDSASNKNEYQQSSWG